MDAVTDDKTQVAVRMYRQGLGDCLLLSFPTTRSKRSFHMLIDCGLVMGHSSDRVDRQCPSLREVAEDIKKATGGRLDVLVATHEHWDHVSGFQSAESAAVFKTLEIQELWLAWTENPDDEDAKKLKARFGKTRDALRAALALANPLSVAHITNVLDFFGAAGTPAAMASVRALLKQGEPTYLEPEPTGRPLTLKDVPGVRIYVLGPPRDAEWIKQIRPKGGDAYKTFLLSARGGAEAPSATDQEQLAASSPFDDRLCIPSAEAEQDAFFKSHYYGNSDEAWRRIDDDWLNASGELALALDSYTNNTSLVLAIELVKSGKVLVFAADAQVGNWKSWGALKWTVKDGGEGRLIGIEDLLKRTVLYKVGHHGSINASLKEYVDQMTSPALTAMLPVDHADALAKRWKDMPWTPLLRALACGGGENAERVIIRMDASTTAKPEAMSKKDWDSFQSRYEENELYMEYTVSG
ncbi:MAG: MBL fold metallo-hydrolase [Chloroflexi bacterium]|nr:MBL fold metallo-hydrolase [Chloroflexota bacterium]